MVVLPSSTSTQYIHVLMASCAICDLVHNSALSAWHWLWESGMIFHNTVLHWSSLELTDEENTGHKVDMYPILCLFLVFTLLLCMLHNTFEQDFSFCWFIWSKEVNYFIPFQKSRKCCQSYFAIWVLAQQWYIRLAFASNHWAFFIFLSFHILDVRILCFTWKT